MNRNYLIRLLNYLPLIALLPWSCQSAPVDFHAAASDQREWMKRELGYRLSEAPRVFLLARRPYTIRVRRAFGLNEGEEMGQLTTLVGSLYCVDSNSILLNSDSKRTFQHARNRSEVLVIARGLILHELVHAWQSELIGKKTFSSIFSSGPEAGMVPLLEGHAEAVTKEYFRRTGHASLYREKVASYRDFSVLNGDYRPEFRYVDAVKFVEHYVEDLWNVDILASIMNRPPSLREIMFPSLYQVRNGDRPHERRRAEINEADLRVAIDPALGERDGLFVMLRLMFRLTFGPSPGIVLCCHGAR